MSMATHAATSSLIASFSSGQTEQTRMKCRTPLHPTRNITPAFVRNENVFFLSPLWFHTLHINKQCGPKSHAAGTAPDQGRHCLGRNEKQTIFFVECASIFIRANSVYPHGIRHTAVFIMIVAFHQDTRLSDQSESWNSSQSL